MFGFLYFIYTCISLIHYNGQMVGKDVCIVTVISDKCVFRIIYILCMDEKTE